MTLEELTEEQQQKMEIVKICKKHGSLTSNETKQGIYHGKKYIKCRHCEIDRSRIYMSNLDDEKIKERKARDKLRWQLKKDEIKKARSTPTYKAQRREWTKKAAPLINQFYKAKQQEYRETLHDSYIRKMIQNGDKTIKMIAIPKSLVDFKRTLLQLKRGIKSKQTKNMGEKINEQK